MGLRPEVFSHMQGGWVCILQALTCLRSGDPEIWIDGSASSGYLHMESLGLILMSVLYKLLEKDCLLHNP